MKKVATKDKRIYQYSILAFLLICFCMGFACFRYYLRLQDTVKSETNGYMQEISKQMATTVSKTISDNFSVLSTISTVLHGSDVASFEEMQKIVTDHQHHWNYQKIMLIDAKGVAYDAKGKTVVLSSDTYLQDVIVSKNASMSASQTIDGKECIVFAIPLENLQIGSNTMLALAGAYELSTFDRILSMTAFDGKGYAHVVRQDGTAVIRSSSPNALQTGYNILQSLSEAKIADNKELSTVYAAIADGESGQIEFSMGDAHEFMTYTPLTTQQWSLLTFVPVSVVNAKSTMLLQLTLLICSIITLAFSLLFVSLMVIFYRNKRRLEQIAYVDTVTGGHTINRFYEMAKVLLSGKDAAQYALLYSNIEKFKVLNEQFGRASCDEILRCIEAGIASDMDDDECIGRLVADNFCLLVHYTDEATLTARFSRWQTVCIKLMEERGAICLPPIVEFGVYVINNNSMPLEHMIDRAKLSIKEATGELMGRVRYAIYDEHVRSLLFREKQLEDMMETALANREFEVFLQPKYTTQSEQIGGAEALVRWRSSTEGMIYPDEFIPLFEKNGFIVQLDLFVFQEVCSTLRRWLDAGLEPIKVSVNCSRMHLKNVGFLDRYSQIAQQYNIPKDAIEIELTENTVFENVETLSEIIREIHHAGFGCSMDDFGSGYSSLNLIQDIPVDTLKLDKIFFRTAARDIQRTESVVGSIITMSKALSMVTVAEGVEEREQVEMLKRLNCDYIQGYYFAKPMPIAQFEKLAFGDRLPAAAT